MSARGETRLWMAQRASAAVLALCVVVHLVTIIYAVRGGLSAAEILSRTRANPFWPAFYTVFVLAAALHGAIGLRTIAIEWLRIRKSHAGIVLWGVALAFAALGLYAVYAVAHS